MSAETTLLDQGSGAPTGFGNDSPFKKKAKKKDPAGSLLTTLGVIAIVVCVAAIFLSF